MHAISSYRGNRPTNKQTNTPTNTNPQAEPITIHCAAASLARSVIYKNINIYLPTLTVKSEAPAVARWLRIVVETVFNRIGEF